MHADGKSTLASVSKWNSGRSIDQVMPQSIPTGYISPWATPGKLFFERANPDHPGNFFRLIPLPRGKMMVEFQGVGQNFPKLEETAS